MCASKDLVQRYSDLSVLVVGDICLDIDAIGHYAGFSREVESLPIFGVEQLTYSPGGAGNLAVNLSALGVRTMCVGMWGREWDIHRSVLEQALRDARVNVDAMVNVPQRTHVFGHYYDRTGRTVIRVDHLTDPLLSQYSTLVRQAISDVAREVDFIVVADYDEQDGGVVDKAVLDTILNVGVPTFGTSRINIVDFAGIDTLVINQHELLEIYSVLCDPRRENGNLTPAEFHALGQTLMTHTQSPNLFVTMGSRGAQHFTLGSNAVTRKFGVPAQSVTDSCGCGDTYLATLSSCLMCEMSVEESMTMADCAARVVLKKLFGTGTATPQETLEERYNESE